MAYPTQTREAEGGRGLRLSLVARREHRAARHQRGPSRVLQGDGEVDRVEACAGDAHGSSCTARSITGPERSAESLSRPAIGAVGVEARDEDVRRRAMRPAREAAYTALATSARTTSDTTAGPPSSNNIARYRS